MKIFNQFKFYFFENVFEDVVLPCPLGIITVLLLVLVLLLDLFPRFTFFSRSFGPVVPLNGPSQVPDPLVLQVQPDR